MLQGHQQQEPAEGPRHLILGPIVPEDESWILNLMAAKNNMDPNCYPVRTTAEVSVCVKFPPYPSGHDPLPPSDWVLLEGDIEVYQFEPVKWEGESVLPPGTQLGAWFRGAVEGDILELNIIYERDIVGSY